MLTSIRTADCGPITYENKLSGSMTFRPEADFFAFSGHFPGRPILPAILQIKLGLLLCQSLTGEKLSLKAIERAKFMLPVAPGTELLVQARLQPGQAENPVFRAAIELTTDHNKVATFSLSLSRR